MAKTRAPRPGSTPSARQNKGGGLLVGFNGSKWLFRADAVTPKDVADLRRATGFGPREIMATLAEGGGIDIDQAGGLIFLARRQCEGRWVTFEAAVDGLTYNSDLELEPEPARVDEDTDSPE